MKVRTLFLLLLALALCPNAAHAQHVGTSTPDIGSMFDRNRSVTVTERSIAGYVRQGVHVGGFTVFPDATLSMLAIDNLYASDTDRTGAVAVTLAPNIHAILDDKQTRIDLTGGAQVARFISRSQENYTLFNAAADGQQTLGSGIRAKLHAGYQRQVQPRSDPGAISSSIKPILFGTADVSGELQWQRGRSLVRAVGSYSDTAFKAGELATGLTLPQDYRDRKLARGMAQFDYALTADFALRIEGSYAESRYRKTAIAVTNRDSRRIELLGGATFEFTDLLRGEIGVGYLNLAYDAPGLRGFKGFGARAQLEYLPTRLTTFTLRASRTIEESGNVLSPAYLRSGASLTVDHELYRNLILSATGGYQRSAFKQPDRTDKRLTAGASARYRLSANVSVVARYTYLHATISPRSSGRTVDINSATVGVNFGF